ncbi:MAG: hypothetical protein ACTSWR_00790 [Candidatus Helarchaeota archaeon]
MKQLELFPTENYELSYLKSYETCKVCQKLTNIEKFNTMDYPIKQSDILFLHTMPLKSDMQKLFNAETYKKIDDMFGKYNLTITHGFIVSCYCEKLVVSTVEHCIRRFLFLILRLHRPKIAIISARKNIRDKIFEILRSSFAYKVHECQKLVVYPVSTILDHYLNFTTNFIFIDQITYAVFNQSVLKFRNQNAKFTKEQLKNKYKELKLLVKIIKDLYKMH